MKNFKKFVRSRSEIAFETDEFFLRNRSYFKREIATLFYETFPYSDIAYHISLDGFPNIYVIDLEDYRKSSLEKILKVLKEDGQDEPLICTSGHSGYHLFYRADDVWFDEMYRYSKRLMKKTKTSIDLSIYHPNHLIRGIYSINLKFKSCPKFLKIFKYSIPIDSNFSPVPFDDEIFNLSDWSKFTYFEDQEPKDQVDVTIAKRYSRNRSQEVHHDVMEQRSRDVNKIKEDIKMIMEIGVEQGLRHDALFSIITTLKAMGLNKNEVIQKVLEFNRRCRPPEAKSVVILQVDQIWRKNYAPPSLNWLKERGLILL